MTRADASSEQQRHLFTPRRLHGRPAPVHAALLPAVPVLALWAGNAQDVHTNFPLHIAGWSIAAALFITAIVTITQRDVRRSALIGSLFVFGFSVHGHIFAAASRLGLVAAGVAIVGIPMLAIRLSESSLRVVTLIANVVAGVLVVANAGLVFLNRPVNIEVTLAEDIQPGDDIRGTDVWYIVPDRYPDLALLEERGIDTRGFRNELLERGFTVVNDAYANYPNTTLSLASAWSGQLLSSTVHEGAPPVDLLRDPLIGHLFVEAGYDYHHLGTWFDLTATSLSATSNLTLPVGQEFYQAYEQTTLVANLRGALPIRLPDIGDYHERQIRHAHHQFDTMRHLASQTPTRPEFVLVHMTLPHPEYVFDEHGVMADRLPETRLQAYEGQLAYLNARLLEIFDLLQQRPEPPIIVLLPDEGLYPDDLERIRPTDYDLGELTPVQIREKMSIIAAVYDPDSAQPWGLPPGTTAVNVVRTLLNRTLDTTLAPEPDIAYIWERNDGELRLAPADLPVHHID